MALIIKAYILVGTDIPTEGQEEVLALLNGAVFDSSSTILDVSVGIEQRVALANDYIDGEFVHYIPSAANMIDAQQFARPH